MISALYIESGKLRCVFSLVTMLLLFQTASGLQVGARHFFNFKPGFKFGVGMKPKAKSADGGKHQNATAGGNCSHWIR